MRTKLFQNRQTSGFCFLFLVFLSCLGSVLYPVASAEIAAASTETSHIADMLKPFKAYWIIGRSAKASPPCAPSHCLYYTWKVISRECRQVNVTRLRLGRVEPGLGESFREIVMNELP